MVFGWKILVGIAKLETYLKGGITTGCGGNGNKNVCA